MVQELSLNKEIDDTRMFVLKYMTDAVHMYRSFRTSRWTVKYIKSSSFCSPSVEVFP